MRLYSLLAALLFTSGFSQVWTGTTTPHASAILDRILFGKNLLPVQKSMWGSASNQYVLSSVTNQPFTTTAFKCQ